MDLKGKRALVTGSSSGIGAAIAIELAAEGCDVAVHGRDRARTEETARAVAAKNVKSVVTCGDLMKDEDAEVIARDALAGLGQIDILVNNVGAVLRMDNPDWMEITPQEWIDSCNLNLVGSVRMVRLLVPAMRERGWGRVINISSVAGSQTTGKLIDYSAPKAALDNFTVNLSKLISPDGVTVNSVIPGTIMTPSVERWLITLRGQLDWPDDFAHNEREYTKNFSPQSIPRLGRSREIAAAVAFLASPLSGYTSGASLRIDGGNANHIGA